MFDRVRRWRRTHADDRHVHRLFWPELDGMVPENVLRMQAEWHAAAQPAADVDDFLPPELRVPGHDQIAGQMMPCPQPIVLDGDVVACEGCGAYRDWIIIATNDQVWLRCRAGPGTSSANGV
ncbi:hypothetical protein GCM10010259_20010 [Streptomyces daghestanicus]|uniref:Uncharacterized protein n=1 Tax=Streptomyces daghestanicus TaxID=66885 RepID=A0ABQ3QC47_9ACTN|nr:hypothetical protein GCM10010259_20010 [Streptomyces daghestanicus]GHI34861.1 hypothetical protein Sdagh_65910 [Streptomyces daghestanicus]